jgi:hypothetical protein
VQQRPSPILTTHEQAPDAIAWEREHGRRLYWWPSPFAYVVEDATGTMRLVTIVDDDLHPTVDAIRAILHDTGARPPAGWLPRRERR